MIFIMTCVSFISSGLFEQFLVGSVPAAAGLIMFATEPALFVCFIYDLKKAMYILNPLGRKSKQH